MSQTSSTARTRAHARWELRLLLRNGEQLLLMFIVPVLLLFALGLSGLATKSINSAVPTVLAVSIMATCFTSLAIGTGFERRSGALRYLGTTPLTRLDLIAGKFLATAALTAISAVVVIVLGFFLSWQPVLRGVLPALLVGLLAAAAWVSWAMVLAGVFRAEAVLAIANGLFLLFIAFGGVAIATSQMPGAVGAVIDLLPSAALANGLRQSLESGTFPALSIGVLAAWTVLGVLLARRSFRWEP
ncbi:MAG: ABC transporter permease [Actinomycetota bacterium]|nr:ABC transporter permease [Actinomycetota bacterium]MDP2288647.1 ABC transporter permease [Actinomycetota bacterium]